METGSDASTAAVGEDIEARENLARLLAAPEAKRPLSSLVDINQLYESSVSETLIAPVASGGCANASCRSLDLPLGVRTP